jgi:DNA-binding LytR/AlgR family response regulator
MLNEKQYRCIVVDDEPIARKILISYINSLPVLVCAGEYKSAEEALHFLTLNQDIDIIFTDINMPNLSGLSLVKIINKNQQIAFTTAHPDFAVESYELNAADYLLKPFSLERFSAAVFKCIERIRYQFSPSSLAGEPLTASPVYIKSGYKNFPVNPGDILFCEAMKNYTKVTLKKGQPLMPLISLSKLEEDLLKISGNFIRVHRSFIINSHFITAVKARDVIIDVHEIPIGNQYKEHFMKAIGMV